MNIKNFPSRISISNTSIKELESISRRLYRICSHSYFHHSNIFKEFEKKYNTTKRFHKLIELYNLFPEDQLIIPNNNL